MKNLALLAALLLVSACPEPRVIVNDPTWEPPDDVRVVEDHIVIDRHINFELDSDVILPTSDGLLNNIADVILHHPEIQALNIIGHTDSTGSPEHNQDLSQRRAASVMAALQARHVGIRLTAIGMGERQPLCNDPGETCNARNRRVEFLIVE